jgi:hypothetical protein
VLAVDLVESLFGKSTLMRRRPGIEAARARDSLVRLPAALA